MRVYVCVCLYTHVRFYERPNSANPCTTDLRTQEQFVALQSTVITKGQNDHRMCNFVIFQLVRCFMSKR